MGQGGGKGSGDQGSAGSGKGGGGGQRGGGKSGGGGKEVVARAEERDRGTGRVRLGTPRAGTGAIIPLRSSSELLPLILLGFPTSRLTPAEPTRAAIVAAARPGPISRGREQPV
ncbi:hypothetical protein F0U60_47325 [Archangium minus]|uniref:Uncharacterized protein n=1 Tax=Archangium minus TaxID=83450 RepID=A0ABY9X673_9BACT|nr:hypothetical protein F0U60_47325 [Archangium minus]